MTTGSGRSGIIVLSFACFADGRGLGQSEEHDFFSGAPLFGDKSVEDTADRYLELGVEEVVVDGQTGLLAKPDARDLADAAVGLLVDPARRAAMGAAGRAVAERAFSAAGQVATMVELYAGLRG